MDKFYKEAMKPALYELSWSAKEKSFVLSIPEIVLEKIFVPKQKKYFEVYKELFEKNMNLLDYGLFEDKDVWGYGDVLFPIKPVFKKHKSFIVKIPEGWGASFSATMYVVFRILDTSLSDEDRKKLREKDLSEKLLEISGIGVGRGGGRSGFNANLFIGAKEWLEANSGTHKVGSVIEAMQAVFGRDYGESYFQARISDDARPFQSCPGDCACFGADSNQTFKDSWKPWIELTSHNIDSYEQQYAHIAGLAAMADEIRKFNAKK